MARRGGLDLVGVGMPGHFLVRSAADADVFVDPFHRTILDREGCEKLFDPARAEGPVRGPLPRSGRAAGGRSPACSPTCNGPSSARGDRAGALWAQCLRVLVPGTTVQDRRQLAAMLAANGASTPPRSSLDAIAAEGGGDRDRHAARALRAKLN